MAVIRLYRKFYKIDSSKAGDLYNLIDISIKNAKTYLKDTIVLVEENPIITRESKGVYYVDLNPTFYSYDKTYELRWAIQYTDDFLSLKTLKTYFKLNPINIASEIETNVENQEIYTEIENQIIEVIIES